MTGLKVNRLLNSKCGIREIWESRRFREDLRVGKERESIYGRYATKDSGVHHPDLPLERFSWTAKLFVVKTQILISVRYSAVG